MNKFIPKQYKHKKIQKRVRIKKLKEIHNIELADGYDFGLKILESGVISSTVLEATRRSVTRKIKKYGTLKINGFASIPVTSKSVGIRMGKGVGSIDKWVFPVKKGRIIFELKGMSKTIAQSALKSAAYKLPVKSKFIHIK